MKDKITYTLPACWASYLINGDGSGLVDSEMTQICDFLEREQLGSCIGCSDESWFARRNDSGDGLAGDVMTFTFFVWHWPES